MYKNPLFVRYPFMLYFPEENEALFCLKSDSIYKVSYEKVAPLIQISKLLKPITALLRVCRIYFFSLTST